jgi:TRAP-type C4-dicarboxylate transport system permease large subunit
VDQEVPMKILEAMRTLIVSKFLFLLVLNVFLLLVGMMMDIFSAIVVVVPLILPIAREFGVDPVHLAIVFLLNLEIGYLTPPVGLNLFIASFRFGRPIVELYRASMAFIVLLLVALAIVTYVPALSLWLPNAIGVGVAAP